MSGGAVAMTQAVGSPERKLTSPKPPKNWLKRIAGLATSKPDWPPSP